MFNISIGSSMLLYVVDSNYLPEQLVGHGVSYADYIEKEQELQYTVEIM